jgi:uncharacterized membrane protein
MWPFADEAQRGPAPGARAARGRRWIGCDATGEYRRTTERRPRMLIWLLVLLLVILAIGGGVALSKFLFLILVVALVVALVGAFGRGTA